ncbi:MAG: ATP-binding protein, partial [Rhodothermales bacterium]
AFIFYEDSQHRLWIGSELGLNLYDPVKDAFLFYTPFSDNEDWGVRAIQEDEHGLIWIGTEGKGLFSFDTEKASFKSYPISSVDAKAGVASTNVLVLFRDSEDILWIGTDKGLNALIRDETGAPTGRFDLYLTQDGLADNGVVGMLEDELGRLWISTSNGLSRATKTAHLEEEEVYGLTFRNYDHRDGLQSNVFYIGPTFKDADGLFYFGGDNGFTVFNPLEIKDNLSAPAVIITDVQLFNKSITAGQTNEDGQVYMEVSAPYAKALNLSHEDRVVSISFAGLHFSSPEKNQYKYRLEGFEDDWNEVGDLRQATYTNLPAGDYVFTVIASNLDGVWNEEGASISISVSPPFLQTGWFRSLAGFIILALLIAVYQIRTRSIRERNARLEKRVAVRTEELRVKNALLESTNDALQLSNTELKESNDNLELKSQELRESIEKNKEILGITAHDLKNPLGGIIGMSDVLLQDAGEMEAHAYVSDSIINIKMLKNEAVQMLQNIRDLLDRYREDHVEEVKTEKADLKVAVETVLRWNHKAAREKNITIVCDEVEEISAEVDVIAIQRVMDNLVSNAVKYSQPGDLVYVTLTRKAHTVRFEVRDTGQGLTSEDKSKVFGKLQRLSAKPTAGEHSTGLGLYIAKKLIKSHDGAVGVDSEFGEGATFWFEVPVPEPVVGIERVLHGRPD